MLGLIASATLPAWAGPRDASQLATAANATGRPRECSGTAKGARRADRITIWDAAREPQLKRYCDLIARAQARLEHAPVAARDAAAVADKILPNHAAPWVVIGRADVVLRRWEDALAAFERARKVDPRSVEEPAALHDLAIAQRQSGKLPAAIETYRVLVPRLALVPGVRDRTSILLEAAALVATLGNDGLREAISLLTEARSQPASPLDADVLAMLALTLDRTGATEQASEVTRMLPARGLQLAVPESESGSFAYLTDPADALAMYALSVERQDPKKSAEWWEKFVSRTKDDRWRDHARRHLEALKNPRKPQRPAQPHGPPR